MGETGQGRNAPHDGAAMTFKEIGKRLGMTRGGAWMAYKSALRKLRRNPAKLAELQRLAALRQQVNKNAVYPDWNV